MSNDGENISIDYILRFINTSILLNKIKNRMPFYYEVKNFCIKCVIFCIWA